MFRLVMVGPAGSGKGTQAKIISQEYNIPLISTGELLRQKAKDGDELGNKIDNIISNGNCVNNEIIFDILQNRLENNDCNNGFILDGFPRNIYQAIELDKLLDNKKTKIDGILVLNVPRDIVFKRTSGRFECVNCKKMYNKFFENTKTKGVCDVCGSNEFFVRKDDANYDAINKRLDIYDSMSSEIINYYDKKNLIYNINALKSIEEIKQVIKDILINLTINKKEEVTIG